MWLRSATTSAKPTSSSEQSSPYHIPAAEPFASNRSRHVQTALHAQSFARQSREASVAPVTSTCEHTPCPNVQFEPGHVLTGTAHTPSTVHHE